MVDTFSNCILLIVCYSLAIVSCPAKAVSSLERRPPLQYLVVFGDSNSDNGNVHNLTNQAHLSSPYWNGRYSNGPNWVDQLDILKITDYAYGGATTDNNLVQGYAAKDTVPVPGMLQQVQLYLSHIDMKTIDFASTLYILWGGGNDFTFNPSLSPNAIAVSLFKSVQTLLSIGAQNILVFNQVPVQYFPYAKLLNLSEWFTSLTNEANYHGQVLMNATQFDNPDASLKIFDIHSLFLKIITQNSSNLTNTVDSCWIDNGTAVIESCQNLDAYFFVDPSHFTSR